MNPKIVIAVEPGDYEKYIQAHRFLNKNALANYVQILENQVPIILNSKMLTTEEKINRYKKIWQKLQSMTQMRQENDIRKLKESEKIPGTREQEMFADINLEPVETVASPSFEREEKDTTIKEPSPSSPTKVEIPEPELEKPPLPPPKKAISFEIKDPNPFSKKSKLRDSPVYLRSAVGKPGGSWQKSEKIEELEEKTKKKTTTQK